MAIEGTHLACFQSSHPIPSLKVYINDVKFREKKNTSIDISINKVCCKGQLTLQLLFRTYSLHENVYILIQYFNICKVRQGKAGKEAKRELYGYLSCASICGLT